MNFLLFHQIGTFSNLRVAPFACLLNFACCGSILQSSPLRILAWFHFFSLEIFRKIVYRRKGFAFVGPNPPSKCLAHIRVCLVTFRLSSRHAAIHLRRLSCSLIPGTYCIFSLFCGKQWKVTFATSGYLTGSFFPFLAVRTVVSTTVMFRHFHAKSLEIAKQNSERLFIFSRMSLAFMRMGLLVPWPPGNTNIVYLLYPIKARINVIKMALHLSIQNI